MSCANAELKFIFSNINDLLKFGEAKNGGLIILNSGITIGVLSSLTNIHPYVFSQCIELGLLALGISVAISIASQFPITQNTFFNKSETSNPNCYFFGDIANLHDQEFIDAYKKLDPTFILTDFDKCLINQILVNARIVKSKFQYFKYASYLTAFGMGVMGISTTIKLLWHF